MAVDHERARAAVRDLLIAVGEDPDREGLVDTCLLYTSDAADE